MKPKKIFKQTEIPFIHVFIMQLRDKGLYSLAQELEDALRPQRLHHSPK